jgi:hypothetical protein
MRTKFWISVHRTTIHSNQKVVDFDVSEYLQYFDWEYVVLVRTLYTDDNIYIISKHDNGGERLRHKTSQKQLSLLPVERVR